MELNMTRKYCIKKQIARNIVMQIMIILAILPIKLLCGENKNENWKSISGSYNYISEGLSFERQFVPNECKAYKGEIFSEVETDKLQKGEKFVKENEYLINSLLKDLDDIYLSKDQYANESSWLALLICTKVSEFANDGYYHKCIEDNYQRIENKILDEDFIRKYFVTLYMEYQKNKEFYKEIYGIECCFNDFIKLPYLAYLLDSNFSDINTVEKIFQVIDNLNENECERTIRKYLLNNYYYSLNYFYT